MIIFDAQTTFDQIAEALIRRIIFFYQLVFLRAENLQKWIKKFTRLLPCL